MGLAHARAASRLGFDADLAVVDLNADLDAHRREVASSAGYSIYEGWEFKGRVVHTLVRGAFAMRDGALDDACYRPRPLPSSTAADRECLSLRYYRQRKRMSASEKVSRCPERLEWADCVEKLAVALGLRLSL